MAIQYVCGGRRIMPSHERDALMANAKHTCDRAVGADEYLYPAGKRARQEGIADENRVVIVYTRFWSTPRWTFVTEGRNRFGDVLATATRDTFEEARGLIEDDLRAQQIIK